ncbi:hypothetical protein ACIGKL_04775 [Pseudomonas sp. NPDC077186]|uniref:hypothetical protein n=1 Tax=Pseudomonas sp. NPDC077186 TaxID=3364421 RepID=UPI0037CA38F6
MSYRTLLAALLFIPLSGCAVYGDGYDYDRGYRDHHHSHHYYNGYRRDYSPPVHVTPRYYHYDERRHDRHRHDSKRYVPAPPPRQQGFYQRDHKRHDGYSRHDGRRDDGRRHDGRQQHKQYQSAPSGKRWEGNRQQQVQQRYSRDDRHSRGEQRRSGEWRRN